MQFERVEEEAPSLADLRDEERQVGSISHADFIQHNVDDDDDKLDLILLSGKLQGDENNRIIFGSNSGFKTRK